MSRDGRSGANTPEFSVSELSGAIKRALEEGFGYVRLRGEISGYRGPHGSGHCYFALKDDKAKIEAVIWKGTFGRLRFKPQEGLEVVAQGRITTFPGSSKYQIVIEALEPAGAGALMALLEERKRKFAAEGLFEEARKKPRPFLPRVIGIVTSPTGAVIRARGGVAGSRARRRQRTGGRQRHSRVQRISAHRRASASGRADRGARRWGARGSLGLQ